MKRVETFEQILLHFFPFLEQIFSNMDAPIVVSTLIEKLKFESTRVHPTIDKHVQSAIENLYLLKLFFDHAEDNQVLPDPSTNGQKMTRLLQAVYSAEDSIDTWLMRRELQRRRTKWYRESEDLCVTSIFFKIRPAHFKSEEWQRESKELQGQSKELLTEREELLGQSQKLLTECEELHREGKKLDKEREYNCRKRMKNCNKRLLNLLDRMWAFELAVNDLGKLKNTKEIELEVAKDSRERGNV